MQLESPRLSWPLLKEQTERIWGHPRQLPKMMNYAIHTAPAQEVTINQASSLMSEEACLSLRASIPLRCQVFKLCVKVTASEWAAALHSQPPHSKNKLQMLVLNWILEQIKTSLQAEFSFSTWKKDHLPLCRPLRHIVHPEHTSKRTSVNSSSILWQVHAPETNCACFSKTCFSASALWDQWPEKQS